MPHIFDNIKQSLLGDLYIRIGNDKKKLSAQQATEYVRRQWP